MFTIPACCIQRPSRVNGLGLRARPSRTAPQPIAASVGATAPPASGRGSACYPVPRRKGSGCWRNLSLDQMGFVGGQFRLCQDRRPNALGFGGIAPQHRLGGADRTGAVYRHSVRDQSRGAQPRPRRPHNCSSSLPFTAIAPPGRTRPHGRCPNRVMCGPCSLRAIAGAFLAGGSRRLSLRFVVDGLASEKERKPCCPPKRGLRFPKKRVREPWRRSPRWLVGDQKSGRSADGALIARPAPSSASTKALRPASADGPSAVLRSAMPGGNQAAAASRAA